MADRRRPVNGDARSQLLGYLNSQRDDQKTTREWVETWLEAHCPRLPAGLDPRTLRAVSRRLRARGRELDRKNKRNKTLIGESPSMVRFGRASECDLQADNLLNEARAIEKKRKTK